jgi:hypothetical protein
MNNIKTITTPQGLEIMFSQIVAWERVESDRGVGRLRIYTTGKDIDVPCVEEEANELIEQIRGRR